MNSATSWSTVMIHWLGSSPASERHPGIEWLNWPDKQNPTPGLLWVFVNFLVLLYVLDRLMLRKLRERTREKHDGIRTELERATFARAQAESLLADIRARMDGLKRDAEQLMEDARARAELDRKRMLEETRAEVERIRKAAIANVEREARQLQQQLEIEVVDRAVASAEAELRRQFQAGDDARLVEGFLANLAATPLARSNGQ